MNAGAGAVTGQEDKTMMADAAIAMATEMVDGALVGAAWRTLADGDDAEIPALDPSELEMPIVMVAGLELLDGCHRILGIARWADEQGIDLDETYVGVPALHVTRELVDAEHPYGERTPDSLVEEWTARATGRR